MDKMNFFQFTQLAFSCLIFASCQNINTNEASDSNTIKSNVTKKNSPKNSALNDFGTRCKALLTSRFKNLEEFKNVVSIQYDRDYSRLDSSECRNSSVTLSYKSNGEEIKRTMSSDINQDDVQKLPKSDIITLSCFIFTHPNIIRLRKNLEDAYSLSRRKPAFYGPGDKAFYDLAEASYYNIISQPQTFLNSKDSSEKGYINTFNHITAQAIITSFFSEELADLISDLHERKNMPEITCGKFTSVHLNDTLNNIVDNYIDILNNEIGQKIGLKLREKYNINSTTQCTPILLSNYLNDVQGYYSMVLKIVFRSFRPSDKVINKFSHKINLVLEKF
ncbi:MAG: hypothetical protein HOP11_07020 [Saprospiraceae bacterium]|nr:hypothetical protein [Saprospiraceae bacterium]